MSVLSDYERTVIRDAVRSLDALLLQMLQDTRLAVVSTPGGYGARDYALGEDAFATYASFQLAPAGSVLTDESWCRGHRVDWLLDAAHTVLSVCRRAERALEQPHALGHFERGWVTMAQRVAEDLQDRLHKVALAVGADQQFLELVAELDAITERR